MIGETKESNLSLEGDASIGGFLLHVEGSLRLTQESLQKYSSILRQLSRDMGRQALWEVTRDDIFRLKARMVNRKLSDSWLSTVILVLRQYLRYAQEFEHRTALFDLALLTPPKRRRREVIFLTTDEVELLVGAIKLRNSEDGSPYKPGYRLRAIIEMILGSGLRISEILSLNHGQIDPVTREAKIIGKGSKERQAFFTARALEWLGKYLELRDDACQALFVDLPGRNRLKRTDIWRSFDALRKRAGIDKAVTPHILRHTAATQLLFNGCPIGHIKEILGHERLETTCRYYLGVDHRAAKAAHGKYLIYKDSKVDSASNSNLTHNSFPLN